VKIYLLKIKNVRKILVPKDIGSFGIMELVPHYHQLAELLIAKNV